MEQVQYDEDDRNDDQGVDPIAGFWETWAYSSSKSAEKPQNYQNDDDDPK